MMSDIKDLPKWKPSRFEQGYYCNQEEDPIEYNDNSLKVTVSMKELRDMKAEIARLKEELELTRGEIDTQEKFESFAKSTSTIMRAGKCRELEVANKEQERLVSDARIALNDRNIEVDKLRAENAALNAEIARLKEEALVSEDLYNHGIEIARKHQADAIKLRQENAALRKKVEKTVIALNGESLSKKAIDDLKQILGGTK
jgi:hypothetical protein